MNASLVFDDQTLFVPESMGKPKDGQLAGTIYENLGELASRICYDSLGTGRTSQALHQHILDVKNHSIYEHIVFTIGLDTISSGVHLHHKLIETFCNRKGVWLERSEDEKDLEVTINLRAILEWDRHSRGFNQNDWTSHMGDVFRRWANKFVPMIVPEPALDSQVKKLLDVSYHKYENLTDDQANITLYLYGSRGFTHEQVRHRFAMSQRSTRYVDEDGSPYIMHPLVAAFLADERVDAVNRDAMRQQIESSIAADRQTYSRLVEMLQVYCMDIKGMTDKTAARKQARGASRGYLGNALASDMLFTTNVTGWKWILSQRKNKLADAEIRQVYTPALEALQSSNYGDRFAEYTLVPSPDGLGTVLA